MKAMISAREALDLVMDRAMPLEMEEAECGESLNRVLGRAVVADRDYPPFDRATMDGFAVKLAHAGKTIRVLGEARPGVAPDLGPDATGCVEIMTGAPCPPGTDAVVMKEEVVRSPGSGVLLPSKIAHGQNIVRAGTECRRGAMVLPEGAVLTPVAIGLLASVGQRAISTRRVPSLAILITGDEVVESLDPGQVQIRDSNGPMLASMAGAAGVTGITRRNVKDTMESLASALDSASHCDVVVLTGGVSAGNYDLVPKALEAYGATTVFHKVAQQPGKPLLFAQKERRLFFGLPGTPLGCHLGFFRYVLPALRALGGMSPLARDEAGQLRTAWSTKSDRQQFLLARAERDSDRWGLTPLVSKGSSDLFTMWSANAYLDVPEGTRELSMNATVRFQWL